MNFFSSLCMYALMVSHNNIYMAVSLFEYLLKFTSLLPLMLWFRHKNIAVIKNLKFIQHNWKIYKYLILLRTRYLGTFWKPRVNRNLIDEKWKAYNSLLFKKTLGDFKKVKNPDYLNFYIVKKELRNQLFKKQMKTRNFPFQNLRFSFSRKIVFSWIFFFKWKILDFTHLQQVEKFWFHLFVSLVSSIELELNLFSTKDEFQCAP